MQQQHFISKIKFLILGTTVLVIMADQASAAHDTITMGAIAGNIHGTASLLARLLWAACIIVGIALFGTAFAQFQTHRRNPKLVPLTTPVMYLILGLLALAIPFAERIFGFQDSNDETEQTSTTQTHHVDIDRN